MKTLSANNKDFEKKWYLVDAENMVVGRLATQIAVMLRGKNKPIFTPHSDTGDFVIVVNAEKVRFTGNKLDDKMYYRHSGYPGGIKQAPAKDILKKHPENILMLAVRGMLPKNRLGRAQLKKLRIYKGSEHPHVSQNPETINLN